MPHRNPRSAQALAEYAATRGFSLPPEVTQHLLAHVQRDMRTLVAVVESLDRYSLETKRAVTLPLIREMLKSAEASGFIQENEM